LPRTENCEPRTTNYKGLYCSELLLVVLAVYTIAKCKKINNNRRTSSMAELPKVYFLDDPKSFAYSTARARWPKILNQTKDESIKVRMEKNANNVELVKQGEEILAGIDDLIRDIESSSKVRLFTAEEIEFIPSLESYNIMFKEFGSSPSWLNGPWLLLECYLYRYIDLIVKSRKEWFDYDTFEVMKRDAFKSSSLGVYELAIRYKTLSEELKKTEEIDLEKAKFLFEEFIDISLWGNATDLSLLANATLEDIQSRQGKEARAKSAKNIIDNDLPEAWSRFLSVPEENRRIDIVLDNAGFEFYTDLSLALFLLDAKLVKNVVFHCKSRPWMVSDTMVKDYGLFIEDMKNLEWFPDHRVEMDYFVESIEKYHANGQFTLKDSEFWTCAYDYTKLSSEETKFGGAELYKYFQDSTLVIVKGDLNYRKLTADRQWPKTTSFATALGSLAQSNIHILALRTCKADVCVGMAEGVEEELIEYWKKLGNEVGELWCSSGKWAVISYSQGH
jgi:uncharacterized protein with ATP-grasp and redox domains